MRSLSMLALVLALTTLGCSTFESWEGVRAWERGVLARNDMAWEPDELEAALRNHIFFSKEASLAGGSAGGGGCGCN